MSRESRLLLVTIVVSAVVLLLLAQLRFPQPPAIVSTTAPLERLAARASFEELATRIAQLETTIAASLTVLRLVPRVDPAPRRFDDLLTRLDTSPAGVHHVPALRLDATTGLAAIPPNARISGIVRPIDASGTAAIVATDMARGLARVRLPEGAARTVPQLPLAALRTPTYVVAVEGTPAGLTLRPVFLGRSDRFESPRWTRALLPLGGIVVTPGALVFTLDGEFLGCAVMENGTLAIAGASEVISIVEKLESSPPAPVDPGIAVEPLTPRLATATGATRGVVVAEVADSGPAFARLQPGDVIIAIGGTPADTPDAALFRLAMDLAAGAAEVTFTREGEVRTTQLAVRAAPEPQADDRVRLQTIRGIGSRVTDVPPGSPFAAGGLASGDVIIRAGNVSSPTAAQVQRTITTTPPGTVLLLTVRRGDRQHLAAIQVPADLDVAR